MDSSTENLKTLFAKTSKHSNYQILPECLQTFLHERDIKVRSRYEKERLDYILKQIDPYDKSVLDIGGNSGYFSFELIDRGAKQVDYYEGNRAHAEFVKVATDLVKFSDRLNVFNEYYDFHKNSFACYDIVLLLNVLHHVGDDYGDKDLSIEKAKKQIIESINYLSDKTEYLIFQLGFCWKGDRNTLLFKNGTKQEMIDFLNAGTKKYWHIQHIGIPALIESNIVYEALDLHNIMRDDKLGEFLNRPIFIMKSKKII